jgi:hypothetical protein
VKLEEKQFTWLQRLEVGATTGLPKVYVIDTLQRRQKPEPIIVGDPYVEAHHSGTLGGRRLGLPRNLLCWSRRLGAQLKDGREVRDYTGALPFARRASGSTLLPSRSPSR